MRHFSEVTIFAIASAIVVCGFAVLLIFRDVKKVKPCIKTDKVIESIGECDRGICGVSFTDDTYGIAHFPIEGATLKLCPSEILGEMFIHDVFDESATDAP